MSYDVYLMKGDEMAEVESHTEGGTYAVGGSTQAHLSITYNYAEVYSVFGFKVWDLDGKRAGDTIEQLGDLVKKLGTKVYRDYWAPTLGNAGHALNILKEWAERHPDAVWQVS